MLRSEEFGGVGLGLSVCFGFLKDHGGDIEVNSRVGEGTTFKVSLPPYTAPISSQAIAND